VFRRQEAQASGLTPYAECGVGIDNESDQVNEGHLVDALALRGDEGRATLRKAARSCEEALIRGYPNGETHFR
jgi:hypothetical protein